MYTIKDRSSRVTVSSFADALHNISEWYQDYASWATGTATHEENQIFRDAIDSVDQPEFGGDLQDYADKICQAIATAFGGKDFHGHGNYSVSAADQMGLSLTVEAASEEIADGVYFLQPDGSDWVAVRMSGNKIVDITSGADAATHNAARDSWAGVEPSDDDNEIEGNEASTIVRLYAARIGLDIDADLVVVSRPTEVVNQCHGKALITKDGLTVYDLDPQASELWAVAGPAGYDIKSIDPDNLPPGFRWVDNDEWADLQSEIDYSTVADHVYEYKFATDSEHGSIMARDFAEAKMQLDKMLQDCDGGFGWVEDHDGERYESQAVCYRFEHGKLYKLEGTAYVHCFSSPYATTEEEAIKLYKSQNV